MLLWWEFTGLEVTGAYEGAVVLACFEILLARKSSVGITFSVVKFDTDPISWGEAGDFSYEEDRSEFLACEELASRA